ncbi:MAG: hypothetical protein IID03_12570, partial [Candidatus Dadabacteria bacterium]|nr:hypothetical protein [Candidatus Dadabacteria bacterium]
MALMDIINSLYKKGLGELLILHTTKGRLYLGRMLYEKGRLVIKDQGFLSSLKSDELLQC